MKYRRYCKKPGCFHGPHGRTDYCLEHHVERPATAAERAAAQRWVDRRLLAALLRVKWPQ